MVLQLKLLAVTLVFAPIFCKALLENAFDTDIDLLAEETDLSAAHVRAPRTAGYFNEYDHYPRFNSPPGPKGYLPPPSYGNQYGGYGGYGGGYGGNPYDSDEDDYDYEAPRPHSHHHHHHRGGSHRHGPPNKGFKNNPHNRGPIQAPNPFVLSNNGRPTGTAPFQRPSPLPNPFLPGPFQGWNSDIDRPIVSMPSQAPTVVIPRPVINPTPIAIDQPTQVVATPPTTTFAPVVSSTDQGNPFDIDIRFGN